MENNLDFQILLNTYAKDIFRKQADCDYIAARSNYRLGLRQQFLWSAQQTIEKYLKSILLFNGISARYMDINGPKIQKNEYGHNLKELIKSVYKLDSLKLKLSTELYKKLIHFHNGSDRYLNQYALSYHDDLEALDELIFRIRPYCQHIPEVGSTIENIYDYTFTQEMHDQKMSKIKQGNVKLDDGYLENILKKDINDFARQNLLWCNLYIIDQNQKDIECIQTTYEKTFSSDEIPPHLRDCFNLNDEELTKLKNYIKLY